MSLEPCQDRLWRDFCERQGLKSTRQRALILDVALGSDKHRTLDEIYEQVRGIPSGVGYATVYRTVRLLVEAGLLDERRFEDGVTRYEPVDPRGGHHDHLVCIDCGQLVEFHSEELERLQDTISAGLGYRLLDHRMELRGRCEIADCPRRPLHPRPYRPHP